MGPTAMHKGELKNIGNNQMLACDVATGQTRRFLTGPTHCEITGLTWTPDGTTMFLNVQHPGETPSERTDPAEPNEILELARLPGRRAAALGDGGGAQEGRRRHRHLTIAHGGSTLSSPRPCPDRVRRVAN